MTGQLNQHKILLDRVREAARLRHYSLRTEDSYVAWIRRYILFHKKRHPADMGLPEVRRFLTHLVFISSYRTVSSGDAPIFAKVLRRNPRSAIITAYIAKPDGDDSRG